MAEILQTTTATTAIPTVHFSLLLDQCKFYPQDKRCVLAGTVTSPVRRWESQCQSNHDNRDEDDHTLVHMQQQQHVNDRCLVYFCEEEMDGIDDASGGTTTWRCCQEEMQQKDHSLPPSPSVASLLQQWNNATEVVRGNNRKKCTGWIRLVVPRPITCYFLGTNAIPILKQKPHNNKNDSRSKNNNGNILEVKSGICRNQDKSIPSASKYKDNDYEEENVKCWMWKKCLHVVLEDDDGNNGDSEQQPTNQFPWEITFALEQFKLYSTKLVVLDGVLVDWHNANNNNNNNNNSITDNDNEESGLAAVVSSQLIRGERCQVHVRSNVKSLWKTLQGPHHHHSKGIATVEEGNERYDPTGWIQLAHQSITVTCRIMLFKHQDDNDSNTSSRWRIQIPRNPRKDNALLFECEEVLSVTPTHPDEKAVVARGDQMMSTHILRRLGTKSFQSSVDDPTTDSHQQAISLLPALQDRQERHRVFAKWLVDTFGVEFLSRGSGVLDVGGGNGKLCQALMDLGVKNAVLLDPDPRCKADTVPFHVIAKPLIGDASDLTETTTGKAYESSDAEVSHLIRTTSLVAGMHPDGATEAIIDTSLRLGVTFAIVPCCFSRKMFPNEPSQQGMQQSQTKKTKGIHDPHRSYSIFCQYLLEKAPVGITFQVENLPFQGRNKVIYFSNYSCQIISP